MAFAIALVDPAPALGMSTTYRCSRSCHTQWQGEVNRRRNQILQSNPAYRRLDFTVCLYPYLIYLYHTMSDPSSSTSAEKIAIDARRAFEASQLVDVSERNIALDAIRVKLEQSRDAVLEANKKDMDVSSSTHILGVVANDKGSRRATCSRETVKIISVPTRSLETRKIRCHVARNNGCRDLACSDWNCYLCERNRTRTGTTSSDLSCWRTIGHL